MERYSDLQFKVFDWLRFPLIVGVVFIHCYGKPFDYEALDFSHLSGMDFYNLFRVGISKVLMHICVPIFYLISGYLFFIGLEKWNWNNYLTKLKKRVKRLLIPFFIWNTLCILMALSGIRGQGWIGIQQFFEDNGYYHIFWDSVKWNIDRTNWIGLTNISSSPYLIPLWFLRDLMVVCICTPLLYYLFKFTKHLGLILLSLCFITGLFIPVPGFSSVAFLFFGIGGFCRMNNINPTKFAYNHRLIIYVITILLFVLCTVFNGYNTFWGEVVYPFFVIVGSITTIHLATYIVEHDILKMPSLLTKGSFFVYLLHYIILSIIWTKFPEMYYGEGNPFYLTIRYLFLPIVIITICIIMYYILNKFTPKLGSFLIGDR